MTIKPITPNQISEAKMAAFPSEVIQIFNDLIAENFSNGQADVYQSEATARIIRALDINSSEIFQKGYLNVEEIYRKAGWKVEYHKPDYTESWKAFFTFRKK